MNFNNKESRVPGAEHGFLQALVKPDENIVLEIGEGLWVLDRMHRKMFANESSVDLSGREFGLVGLLASSPGIFFNDQNIITRWEQMSDKRSTSGVVKVIVYRVRKKFERIGLPGCIESERKVGYRLRAHAID